MSFFLWLSKELCLRLKMNNKIVQFFSVPTPRDGILNPKTELSLLCISQGI